jgi:LuxR family maltose regulon positive regulatory protein
MIDIRADDLRFSPQETAIFLNQVMGLALSSDQVATLETRTEGWIAGLQLAALSMQGQEDAAGFISALAADDRYIADYLVDEVLARRPKGTKDFLLQTSILDRMTGPLCDAVTGQEGGQEVLQRLERANLFIVPLDNRRRWYRYHHLFSDLLRKRLEESTTPHKIRSLHQCASQWYEENRFLVEAVEHGLAAGEYEDVIRLIELGAHEMLMLSQQQHLLLGWWAELPQKLVVSKPKLCMTYAWAWVATGHPEEAERCLQAVEQALGTEMTELYTEGEEAKAMAPAIRGALAEVAVMRAQLAIGRGDISEALKLTSLALPYLEDDEGPYLHNPPIDSRTIVFFIMGLAHKFRGELGTADEAFTETAALAQERGNVHIVAGTFGHQAGAQTIQGHLRQAVQTCQRGLQLVQEMVGERSPISGLMQVELGNLLYKQNNLEAALHHLQEGIAVAKPWSHWDTLVPGHTGLARVRVAQGDWGGAFAALNELAALGKNNPRAVMPAVESFRAMLCAAQGKVDEARRWAQTAGLDVDSEINFLREGELIILARVLMAQKQWNEAARLIDRLLGATETGKRWGRVIEVLILRALVLNAQGKQDKALESLGRALALAEPEGYVRIFVDEGEPMRLLISDFRSRIARQAPGSDLQSLASYADGLLAAFGDATMDKGRKTELLPSSSVLGHSSLVEPLSKRELEVLQLIAEGLTNPEIASRLFLALNTVKAHTRNIYGKLGVHSRTQAVARSQELGLLPRGRV